MDLICVSEDNLEQPKITNLKDLRVDVEAMSPSLVSDITSKLVSSKDLSRRPDTISWDHMKAYQRLHQSVPLQAIEVQWHEPTAVQLICIHLARVRWQKSETLLQDAIGAFIVEDYSFSMQRARSSLSEAIDGLIAVLGDPDVQRKRRLEKLKRIRSEQLDLNYEFRRLLGFFPMDASLAREAAYDAISLTKIVNLSTIVRLEELV